MSKQSISTSLEYQILDGIRSRLGLSPKRLQAPSYEIEISTGRYVRHCRLLVRERDLNGLRLLWNLFLGLDLQYNKIEVYTPGAWLRQRRRAKQIDANAVYAVADLHDSKYLSGVGLRRLVQSGLKRAVTKEHAIYFRRPLYTVEVDRSTFVGPYS